MAHFWKSGAFWLLLLIAGHAAWMYQRGNLGEPKAELDTPGYLSLSRSDLFSAAALANYRTLGYPVFLWAAERITPGLACVPLLHHLVFYSAILLFYLGLRRIGATALTAALAAGILLPSEIVFDFRQLLPDGVATSLAVMTVAAWMMTLGRRAGWGVWLWLTAVLFLTYQVRPAYLFLIPLLPLLGLICYPVVRFGDYRRLWTRYLPALLLVVLGPLVAFCGLRLAIVGQFRLVSFNGLTVIGWAGSLLTEDMIPHLPADTQPLARDILFRRDVVQKVGPARPGPPPNATYDEIVWRVACPVAQARYQGDWVAMDDALVRLSLGVLRQAPLRYARWVRTNFAEGYRIGFRQDAIGYAVGLLFGAWLTALILRAQVRRGLGGPLFEWEANEARAFVCLVVVAGTFLLAKTALVVLVEMPLVRYILPAALFLPTVPAAAAAIYCRQVVRFFAGTASAVETRPDSAELAEAKAA
jgi:hypothetical protein